MITVVVKTKDNQLVTVMNPVGWDNFLLYYFMARAVVGNGIYIPMENVASIHIAPQAGAQPGTSAQVLHLVPNPGQAPVPEGAA